MNLLIVNIGAQEQINKNTFDNIGDFFKNILNKITGKTITGNAIQCWANSDCPEGEFCYVNLPGCMANPSRDCPTQEFFCSSSAYCGDGTCNNGETCSSCPADVGACPTNDGGGSGGGGGGGGGSGGSATAKNTQIDNSATTSVGDTPPEENNEETNLADENQTPQEETPSIWQRILNFFRGGEPTGAAITGAAIGKDGQTGGRNMGIIIITLVVIAGIAGVLIWHNKKKKAIKN